MVLNQCLVVIFGLFALASASKLVEERSFEEIEAPGHDKVALFYRSSLDHGDFVDLITKTAERVVPELKAKGITFKFENCDGDADQNKEKFSGAGFDKAAFVFTSTAEGEKYTGPLNADALTAHILELYEPTEEGHVQRFVNEDDFFDALDDSSKPFFVKFYEEWCTHCKQLKKPFMRSAKHFKDRVQFWEVQCSENDETKAFCQANGVSGYPTLMLFDGDRKVKFNEPSRNKHAFAQFFDGVMSDKSAGTKSTKSTQTATKQATTPTKTNVNADAMAKLEAKVAELEKKVAKLTKRLDNHAKILVKDEL